ncbi:hypothetical protein [Streptomyces sp. NPDC052225]|uniref:hypothetical protein n=1 Tax=Streptomyces sp. NPDC052225 TaxID=3154949 RepID=UPI0034193998
MAESNGTNVTTDSRERREASASGRHRGAVATAPAHGEQPEPRGRHRGPRAQEA